MEGGGCPLQGLARALMEEGTEGTEGEKGPVLVSNSVAFGQSHLILRSCCLLARASTQGEPLRGTEEGCWGNPLGVPDASFRSSDTLPLVGLHQAAGVSQRTWLQSCNPTLGNDFTSLGPSFAIPEGTVSI